MSELSVVIICLDLDENLKNAVASLGARGDFDLIIAHHKQSEELNAFAGAVGAQLVQSTGGRGAQLGAGAGVARCDWLLFLHSDSVLPQDWTQSVYRQMETGRAGAFKLSFRASGFGAWQTAAWANLRTRLGLPYGDQGLLISRGDYERIGGYADLPLMEDVDLVRRLKGQIDLMAATLSTDAGKYLARGWYRQGAANLWRLMAHYLGADAHKQARKYKS